LQGIAPEVTFGPKGQAGAIYSRYTAEEALRDLRRAADMNRRVALRVHDVNGWHEGYVNVGRQAGKGINAGYLLGRLPGRMSLSDFIRGMTTGSGVTSGGTERTPGYTFGHDLDAFQVVVYS